MKKQRVVVIGGGFGGAFTARHLKKLAKDRVEVELINHTNYFVFQPLLPEVAAGTINASDAVTPLRVLLPGIKVRMADVEHLDTETKSITLMQGRKLVPITINYDHLVIASGLRTDLSRFPGFDEHSFTMKDLSDAHALRNHVIQCLEHADVTEDAELKKRLLTFVVAGGGFSGVETIGEMSEMVARTLKYYPNIHPSELKGVLIQKGPRLLPELPESSGAYALKELSKRNIDVRLDMGTTSATGTSVTLEDGTVIPTSTLVTTVGNGPTELMKSLPVDLIRGRLLTNRRLQIEGLKDVWAVGDVALIPLTEFSDENATYAPPTAQFAVREAKFLAKTILADIDNQHLHTFHYEPRGSMASIGHYKAVAKVFNFNMSGLFAWILWRGFYISMVPSFSTRLRIGLNWMFDYVLPRKIVQVRQKAPRACRYKRYAKGDVLFEPGQVIDGFYTVLSGALESYSKDDSGEELVRVVGPGDHWGERALAGNFRAVGRLTAVKDTKVMMLQRDDFNDFRASFPSLTGYFDTIHESVYPKALRNEE